MRSNQRMNAPLQPTPPPLSTPREKAERFLMTVASKLARWPAPWRWRAARFLAAVSLAQRPSPLLEMLKVNVKLCFPEWSEKQQRQFVRANFTENLFAALECFHVEQLGEQALRQTVTLENADRLHRLVGAGPLVLLCPHFLSMEFGVQRLALEYPAMSIYNRSGSALIDAMRLKARSRFCPQHLVPIGAPLLPVVRKLRAGLPLFLLPDLDMGLAGATFAPFFGVPAATLRTTAWCVNKTQATLLPVSTRRVGLDRYIVSFGEPVTQLSPNLDEGTAQVNVLIEAMVRDMPEQYLWAQPRFKTRPSGEAPVYSQAVLGKAAE
jgi:Kdo2-lipid IVA lauroyltransferase/acyltransferase